MGSHSRLTDPREYALGGYEHEVSDVQEVGEKSGSDILPGESEDTDIGELFESLD